MRISLLARVAGAAAVLIPLAGCTDDGNDVSIVSSSAAILDEQFGSTTTDVAPNGESPSEDAPDDPSDPAATVAPGEVVSPTGVVIQVAALDNSFRPEAIEINVGDEVDWQNRGQNEHNILYIEGADWGIEVEDFQPGAFYSHIFTVPGEYRYYCSIHGTSDIGMVGTIIVTA